MTAIILTIAQAIILVLGYLVYRRTKKAGLDPNKHSLPEHINDGRGVVIKNKKGLPVTIFEKELK